MLKLIVSLGLALTVVVSSTAAFSGQFEIEIGPGWARGKADAAPIGKVLTELTQQAGYPVYIDEQLQGIPVSFCIQDKLNPERFIKHIVRPHSYAVVFAGGDTDEVSRIQEIWVFRRGEQFTAKYIDLRGTPVPAESSVSSNSVSPGTVSASTPSAPSSPGHSRVNARTSVKRRLHVKENAYGGPLFTQRDPKKRPDYRPTPYQRQQAYWKYRSERKDYEQRIAAGMLRARGPEIDSRRQYWARRNSMIRQHIMNLENSKDEEEKE